MHCSQERSQVQAAQNLSLQIPRHFDHIPNPQATHCMPRLSVTEEACKRLAHHELQHKRTLARFLPPKTLLLRPSVFAPNCYRPVSPAPGLPH